MINRALGSGFDLGTSPHGLAAELPLLAQETPEAISCHSPAKPLLTFRMTEEQRRCLAFAAFCEAEALAEGEEADELEVQEAIRNLWEAHYVLNGEPS